MTLKRGALAHTSDETLGLKTTYYLRSRSATHVEKSTLKRRDGKLNGVSAAPILVDSAKACALDDPTCEAYQ
jgi:ribonucleoside-diphosphate reductase alpha chain